MLYHPYILAVGMILFLAGAVEGYRKAKSLPSSEKSRHSVMVYTAYSLFLLALGIYYGYERNLALEIAGGREAFRDTGLLLPHVISITASTILISVTLVYGIAMRGRIFTERIGRNEIVHMVLGSLGIAFYVLAVVTGAAMYMKAGVL
jgi:cellulose synthase/poly-beta-1,6-N-acetylglucosamine synthase-like glycosyltransferase